MKASLDTQCANDLHTSILHINGNQPLNERTTATKAKAKLKMESTEGRDRFIKNSMCGLYSFYCKIPKPL